MKVRKENTYLLALKQFLNTYFRNDKVKIVLFGSRATSINSIVSDVDIGIMPDEALDKKKIAYLAEKIDNLNLPYKVEIVDFSEVANDFRENALKEAVVWKK